MTKFGSEVKFSMEIVGLNDSDLIEQKGNVSTERFRYDFFVRNPG